MILEQNLKSKWKFASEAESKMSSTCVGVECRCSLSESVVWEGKKDRSTSFLFGEKNVQSSLVSVRHLVPLTMKWAWEGELRVDFEGPCVPY